MQKRHIPLNKNLKDLFPLKVEKSVTQPTDITNWVLL
jgi:hypothetical protein